MTPHLRFEELSVWRTAIELGARVFAMTEDRVFANQPELSLQFRRAALHISSFIAEGCERGSTSELIRCVGLARGSAGQLRSLLIFAEQLPSVRSVEASEVFSAEGLQSLIDDLKSHAESLSSELQTWLDALRDTPVVTREDVTPTRPQVFIPGEHVRAFIAKLEKFRAGADPREVFGHN